MADSSIRASEIEGLFTYLGDMKSIAVGFNDSAAIAPLTSFLQSLISKETKKEVDAITEGNKDARAYYNTMKEHYKAEVEESRQRHKQRIKKQDEATEHLRGITQNTKKHTEILRAYTKQALDILLDIGARMKTNTTVFGNTMRGIESSGVLVSGSFNQIADHALKAGISLENYGKIMQNHSTTFNKLTARFGNGSKFFSDAIANMTDDLALTKDEKVSILDSFVKTMSPSRLQKMSQEQFYNELDKYTHTMKELSITTGKTIDNLNAENDIKSKSLRIQAYERTHQGVTQLLKELGMGDDTSMDYITSNGVRSNAEMVTRMANSPYQQGMYRDMIRLNQQGRLTADAIRMLVAKWSPYAHHKIDLADRASMNGGIMGASSASNEFQNTVFYTEAEQKAIEYLSKNQYDNIFNSEEGRKNRNMLGALTRAKASEDNNLTYDIYNNSGGVDGTTDFWGIQNGWQKLKSIPKSFYKNMTDRSGFTGILSGMISNGIQSATPHLINYGAYALLYKAGNELYKAAMKLQGKDAQDGKLIQWVKDLWGGKTGGAIKGFGKNIAAPIALGLAGRMLTNGWNGMMNDGDKTAKSYLPPILGQALPGVIYGFQLGGVKGALLGGVVAMAPAILDNIGTNIVKNGIVGGLKQSALDTWNTAKSILGSPLAMAIAGGALGAKVYGITGALIGAALGFTGGYFLNDYLNSGSTPENKIPSYSSQFNTLNGSISSNNNKNDMAILADLLREGNDIQKERMKQEEEKQSDRKLNKRDPRMEFAIS